MGYEYTGRCRGCGEYVFFGGEMGYENTGRCRNEVNMCFLGDGIRIHRALPCAIGYALSGLVGGGNETSGTLYGLSRSHHSHALTSLTLSLSHTSHLYLPTKFPFKGLNYIFPKNRFSYICVISQSSFSCAFSVPFC